MSKSWIAQDFYNEYLTLKDKILDTTTELSYCLKHHEFSEMAIKFQQELDPLIERFRFVLEQLKLEGVELTDLILLSVGVEIDLFN